MNEATEDIRVVALKCPNCGGALEVPPGTDRTRCEHCGSTVLIVDPRSGETRLEQALVETPEEAAAKKRMIKIILWVVVLAVVVPFIASFLIDIIVAIVSIVVAFVTSGVIRW